MGLPLVNLAHLGAYGQKPMAFAQAWDRAGEGQGCWRGGKGSGGGQGVATRTQREARFEIKESSSPSTKGQLFFFPSFESHLGEIVKMFRDFRF